MSLSRPSGAGSCRYRLRWLSMKTRTYPVCFVETPTHTYTKAKATLTDTELTVMDRRGKTLFTVPAPEGGPVEEDTAGNGIRKVYRYGDVVVRNLPGACGCGGLRIVEKSNQRSTP